MTGHTHPKRDRRASGLKAVGADVSRITKPIVGKRGFAAAAILTDWPNIVGSALASQTAPLRIIYPKGERAEGILHISITSSAIAPVITHLQPLVLQKINSFFGYRAVAGLKLIHGRRPQLHTKRPPPQPMPVLTREETTRMDAAVDKVEDPELKAVLERLKARLQGA